MGETSASTGGAGLAFFKKVVVDIGAFEVDPSTLIVATPDADINLSDVLALLDAFQGMDPCCQ